MRLSQIDASNIDDHYYLNCDDECYYFFEYTSRRDFSFSRANSIISNLKKKPSNSGRGDYKYKIQAINEVTQMFCGALNQNWLAGATLVPVPGSKADGHPDYDDRIGQICRGLGENLDVRDLVIQSESTTASHEAPNGERVTIEELERIYRIDETLAQPEPSTIAIFDDVLTAGTHYSAMKSTLLRRFPNVNIKGFFVARRVFPDESSVEFL